MRNHFAIVRKIARNMLYATLFLVLIWLIAIQSGCFPMRTPDARWQPKLQQLGQDTTPLFFDIQSVENRVIHAVAVSSSDDLPLLMMAHGSPGSADAYLSYLADTNLSKVARLVAFDRPGFGYTSGFGKPEPSQAVQAAALKSVADTLAPGQKVWLLGHSLGGAVIARFAMDYPERTAGLVIVAGSIDPKQERHPWWEKVVDAAPVRWLTPKSLWTSNAEIIPLEKELEAMIPFWERITCPVRIIHASNDQLVPVANAEFAQKALLNCPDIKIEILPKGNHFILWSRQDVVRAALLDIIH